MNEGGRVQRRRPDAVAGKEMVANAGMFHHMVCGETTNTLARRNS
jgi:hypothetical protein